MGHEVMKKADITIDLKRPEPDKMKEWNIEQKIAAKAFIERISGQFEIFKNEILKAIK
jgi:hypothetical protein